MNRHFSKEDTYTDNRHMKKVLSSTAHQANAIQTTMKYHFAPVRRASIKSQEITRVGEATDESKLLCTVRRNVNWYNHNGK